MNQQIRQEQDTAYEESLRADQEKERKKREERQKCEQEEKLKKDKVQQEQAQRDKLLRLKVDLASSIPQEPPQNHPDAIRVLIKLPNGTRLERRFVRSVSIKYLVFFIFCHEQSPVAFQVTTNFPRRELPCKPPTVDNQQCHLKDDKTGEYTIEPPSFAELDLGKSEMIFVHDLEA